jgi:hypothetical protein
MMQASNPGGRQIFFPSLNHPQQLCGPHSLKFYGHYRFSPQYKVAMAEGCLPTYRHLVPRVGMSAARSSLHLYDFTACSSTTCQNFSDCDELPSNQFMPSKKSTQLWTVTSEQNSRDSIHEMWYVHYTNGAHPNVLLSFLLLIKMTQHT